MTGSKTAIQCHLVLCWETPREARPYPAGKPGAAMLRPDFDHLPQNAKALGMMLAEQRSAPAGTGARAYRQDYAARELAVSSVSESQSDSCDASTRKIAGIHPVPATRRSASLTS